MHSPPLILASASPRRRELLAVLGVAFEVIASDAAEIRAVAESPTEFALRVAADKAAAVARRRPEAVVLGADTIVIRAGELFGKPRDRNDAKRMLAALSDTTHEVATAVAVITPNRTPRRVLAVSRVRFRRLAEVEIDRYVDGDEPYDKAGAYALQGEAGRFVAAVAGARSNVIGLPLHATWELLRDLVAAREPGKDD